MVLLAISQIFLHENNRNYISYRFSYKFAFIVFLFFLAVQKVLSKLVVKQREIFLFFVFVYFRIKPNSIDFYKEIFLHVVPVLIIVPCHVVACEFIEQELHHFSHGS